MDSLRGLVASCEDLFSFSGDCLRTAAASRPYLGSMVGGTPTLLEGLLGGSAARRGNVLVFSFYQLPMSSAVFVAPSLPLLKTSKEAGFLLPGLR